MLLVYPEPPVTFITLIGAPLNGAVSPEFVSTSLTTVESATTGIKSVVTNF